MTARILILDIETAPNIAYVWGAWKQNVGQNQWVKKSHIMSFAAKWLHEEHVMYEENRKADDSKIVYSMYSLLDEADIVVAHNGRKFDIPIIIGRGVVHGYTPPSPYYVVDTLDVARRELRMQSNSLASLCEDLGLSKKGGHKKYPGFELWLGCLRGEEEAWKEMGLYNIQDVMSLEELYLRLRPYMRNHPHVGRFSEEVTCPKCGGTHLQWRGYAHSRAGLTYRRFQCQSCGGWGREHLSERDMKALGRNASY